MDTVYTINIYVTIFKIQDEGKIGIKLDLDYICINIKSRLKLYNIIKKLFKLINFPKIKLF